MELKRQIQKSVKATNIVFWARKGAKYFFMRYRTVEGHEMNREQLDNVSAA